jgi:hypothetical protein
MNVAGRPVPSDNIKRRNWARLIRDILLLPPALLYVIVERVFWTGAQTLLRQAARIEAVASLQKKLAKLPVAVVLPLFLVPEIFSHIGGFWASVLLVKRQWVAAVLVGIFIKGLATLMVVWIYQSSAPTLLSVRWFAWVHMQFLRGRDWVAQRIKPATDFALRLVRGNRSRIARRFTAIRKLLIARLGLHHK